MDDDGTMTCPEGDHVCNVRATMQPMCRGCGGTNEDYPRDADGNHDNCVRTARNLRVDLAGLRTLLERMISDDD